MLVLSDEFTLNSALEKMRFDIKRALLDARKALLELPAAVCPRKSKSDKSGAVPSMYECNSWTATTEIPWNTEHERALTPAEGITKLGAKLQQCEFELRLVHNELAAIRGSPVSDKTKGGRIPGDPGPAATSQTPLPRALRHLESFNRPAQQTWTRPLSPLTAGDGGTWRC